MYQVKIVQSGSGLDVIGYITLATYGPLAMKAMGFKNGESANGIKTESEAKTIANVIERFFEDEQERKTKKKRVVLGDVVKNLPNQIAK